MCEGCGVCACGVRARFGCGVCADVRRVCEVKDASAGCRVRGKYGPRIRALRSRGPDWSKM